MVTRSTTLPHWFTIDLAKFDRSSEIGELKKEYFFQIKEQFSFHWPYLVIFDRLLVDTLRKIDNRCILFRDCVFLTLLWFSLLFGWPLFILFNDVSVAYFPSSILDLKDLMFILVELSVTRDFINVCRLLMTSPFNFLSFEPTFWCN